MRPSLLGIRGARRNRPTRRRPWGTRDAALPGTRGCRRALPGCASIPGRLFRWPHQFAREGSRDRVCPFWRGKRLLALLPVTRAYVDRPCFDAVSFAPSGLVQTFRILPAACAVGCILSPL